MEYKPWLFESGGAPVAGEFNLPQNDTITTPSGMAGYFSRDECKEMIRISKAIQPRDAITGDGKGGHSYSSRVTDVREVYPGDETDWVFRKLQIILTQINLNYQFDISGFMEGTQIYEYKPGGYLDWHMDIAKGYMSTRKLSMSVQLSDGADYEGGDLEFLDFKDKKAPRGLGDLIVFPSYMMHRVTTLTQGTRISWVSWVHGKPFC